MDNDIVGQCYVATDARDATPIVWVVSDQFQTDMKFPHALLRKSGDPNTSKLIAVNALKDKRLYRMVG